MSSSSKPQQETTTSLAALRPGDRCHLDPAGLEESDAALLEALGLRGRSPVRLCQSGDPWIVEVRGTRIGLADEVARRLQVVRDVDSSTSAGTR